MIPPLFIPNTMKFKVTLHVLAFSFVIAGCSSEKAPDDSKPAPKPQFKMVPSQKSGG